MPPTGLGPVARGSHRTDCPRTRPVPGFDGVEKLMNASKTMLSRQEIKRLSDSLAQRSPQGVPLEDLARVVHWAWRARLKQRPRDGAFLEGVLEGKFEISVSSCERPGRGLVSDP